MHHTVAQLTSLVRGQTQGDGGRWVVAARALHEAGPDDISFLEHERHIRAVRNTNAGCVVLAPAIAAKLREVGELPFVCIEVDDPFGAFLVIAQHLQAPASVPLPGVHPSAVVHPSAKLGADCRIMAHVVIGENADLGARCFLHPGTVVGAACRLGDDVVLHPHVVLYDRTVLGHRVVVHANAVLGADGFGYRFLHGKQTKVPQLGNVEIGDDVEIGACTTIDRGTFQATRVGEGTKIDNLVMVGHNCRIGRHTVIVGQVGLAGSCVIGDYVVIAGQAGVADHVTVHDRAVLGACTAAASDVPPDARMLGAPAMPERETKRIIVSMASLPNLIRDVREIKRWVGENQKEAG